MVWGCNGSSGSGFGGFGSGGSFDEKGFAMFQHLPTERDGSGSSSSSWKAVLAVPVPLSVTTLSKFYNFDVRLMQKNSFPRILEL